MTPEQIDLLKALKDLDQWVTDWLKQIHRDIDDDEKAKLADDMACDWFGSGMGASFRDQIAEAEQQREALHSRNVSDMLASARAMAPPEDGEEGVQDD